MDSTPLAPCGECIVPSPSGPHIAQGSHYCNFQAVWAKMTKGLLDLGVGERRVDRPVPCPALNEMRGLPGLERVGDHAAAETVPGEVAGEPRRLRRRLDDACDGPVGEALHARRQAPPRLQPDEHRPCGRSFARVEPTLECGHRAVDAAGPREKGKRRPLTRLVPLRARDGDGDPRVA